MIILFSKKIKYFNYITPFNTNSNTNSPIQTQIQTEEFYGQV